MKDNNISKNNNKLAGWIEDFLTNFAKVTNQGTEEKIAKETLAEININDLDKVVWNDETFYVYFDEDGASIINVFGNTVTVLDGIMTLEEVNQQLNSKQIVSSIENELVVNSQIENEIENALSSIEQEADTIDDQRAQDYVDSYNQGTTNNETQNDQTKNDQTFQQNTSNEGLSSTGYIQMEGVSLKEYDEKTAAIISEKLAEMEEKLINTFEEKINTLMEQMYARINPGNIYDMGDQIQQQEVLKFTDEALETEQQIAQENEIDRTIVDNKYSNQSNDIEQVLVEEETFEEPEEILDETEEILDETEEILDEMEEVSDMDNDIIELEEIEDTEEIENTEEDLEEVEDAELEGVELEGDDAEVFKEAKCPYCSTSLSKIAMKTNSIEISCDNHECGTRYSVDTNTGKIYII